MVHLSDVVIASIVIDIISSQSILFHDFCHAVILFPLVETTVLDNVDVVFGILDFAIYYTGGDFMAMYKRASGIFTLPYIASICSAPIHSLILSAALYLAKKRFTANCS